VFSSKQTQAKLDEFRQMPQIQPDYEKATLEGLQVVERYWHWHIPVKLRKVMLNYLSYLPE
jgi:hypothetical protein